MSDSTWGNYQSFIQLAAGFNFAYAGIEAILRDRLPLVSEQQKAVISSMMNYHINKPSRNVMSQINLVRYHRTAIFSAYINNINRFILTVDPFLSMSFCGICVLMLWYSSEYYEIKISLLWKLATFALGFGWLIFVVLAALIGRSLVIRVIEPTLREIQNAIDG